jgi:hypothetical protein
MEQLLRDLLVIIAGAALGILGKIFLTPKEHAEKGKAQSETIEIQGRTLADAFDEIRELRKEMDDMREQLKKYQRALERAIKHIRTLAPNDPIPDFLKDTGDFKK